MFKRIASLLISAALITAGASALTSCGGADDKKDELKLTENIADGTILQCFCWNFKTIEKNLNAIAAAGYSTIQTSPINECLEGEGGGMSLQDTDKNTGTGKWYYHYQPTDYKIGNYQLGTREEFKSMCKKADKLGIKVIVDVVANHTTTSVSEVSQGLRDAVGGIENLYHKNNDKDIVNWANRLQCTTYKMGGLPDINTENKDFQDYFIAYLNDCIECGADGFRYDAAKHIALPDDPTETKGVKNNFWKRVTTEIKDSKRIFNYGEVLQGQNDRASDYVDMIGACTASSYGGTLRTAIISGNVDKTVIDDLKISDKTSCVTWVESHDNYINDGNWAQMDDEQIRLGWAIIAARDKGTPLFFNRPVGSSLESQWGTKNKIGITGNNNFKDPSVKAVNFFRNNMVGEEENILNPDDRSTAIQICRGNKGAVIVTTIKDIEDGFETDLADGTYTDHVDGKTVYTVKDGKLTCEEPIEAYSVIVLY